MAILSTAFLALKFLLETAFSYFEDKDFLKLLFKAASKTFTLVSWSGVALNILFNVDLDKGWSNWKLMLGYFALIAFLSCLYSSKLFFILLNIFSYCTLD